MAGGRVEFARQRNADSYSKALLFGETVRTGLRLHSESVSSCSQVGTIPRGCLTGRRAGFGNRLVLVISFRNFSLHCEVLTSLYRHFDLNPVPAAGDGAARRAGPRPVSFCRW